MQSFRRYLSEQAVVPPNLLKCFFLAGGPGSGKSSAGYDAFSVANHGEQSVSAFGLMYTASDIEFEKLMWKHDINPKDIGALEETDPRLFSFIVNTLRPEAKRITDAQRALYMSKRLGIVFDGTGRDYEEKAEQKAYAESIGYDTWMIYAQTSLEEALARNERRERTLPADMVIQTWMDAEANRPKYQTLFGASYFEVEKGNTVVTGIKRFIAHALRMPVQNPIGRMWLDELRAK